MIFSNLNDSLLYIKSRIYCWYNWNHKSAFTKIIKIFLKRKQIKNWKIKALFWQFPAAFLHMKKNLSLLTSTAREVLSSGIAPAKSRRMLEDVCSRQSLSMGKPCGEELLQQSPALKASSWQSGPSCSQQVFPKTSIFSFQPDSSTGAFIVFGPQRSIEGTSWLLGNLFESM